MYFILIDQLNKNCYTNNDCKTSTIHYKCINSICKCPSNYFIENNKCRKR